MKKFGKTELDELLEEIKKGLKELTENMQNEGEEKKQEAKEQMLKQVEEATNLESALMVINDGKKGHSCAIAGNRIELAENLRILFERLLGDVFTKKIIQKILDIAVLDERDTKQIDIEIKRLKDLFEAEANK